jgi:hypothetical protein
MGFAAAKELQPMHIQGRHAGPRAEAFLQGTSTPQAPSHVWLTNQGPPCGVPWISKASDLRIAQGMVNTSENGEVWPEPELIWGWYTAW